MPNDSPSAVQCVERILVRKVAAQSFHQHVLRNDAAQGQAHAAATRLRGDLDLFALGAKLECCAKRAVPKRRKLQSSQIRALARLRIEHTQTKRCVRND
jgi:hypothetical protein